MAHSDRRRGFLLGVASTGAVFGLNRLVPRAASAEPRADSERGAMSDIPLPFWATRAALPAGTWQNIGSSTVRNEPNIKPSSSWYSGQYAQIMTQWSGGAFSDDYSNYGGYCVFGNGHAAQDIGLLCDAVLVWNCDTTKWEIGVPQWWDRSKILAASICPGSMGADTSGTATLSWRSGRDAWWSSDTYAACGLTPKCGIQQRNLELNARGEYVEGVIAAQHTYGCCFVIPHALGGDTKGSLIYPLSGSGVGGGSGAYPSNAGMAIGLSTYGGMGGCFSHEARLAAKKWQRYTRPTTDPTGWFIGEAARGSSYQNPYGCSSDPDLRRRKGYFFGGNMDGEGNTSRPNQGPGPVVFHCDTRTVAVCKITNSSQWGNNLGNNVGTYYSVACMIPHDSDGSQDLTAVISGSNRIWVIWSNWMATLGSAPGADSWAGFWQITTQGDPATALGAAHCGGVFVRDLGTNGSIVMLDTANHIMWKLAVPSGNRRTDPWVWTSEQLVKADTGTIVNPNDYTSNGIFNRLMYARKAKALLIAPNEGAPMRAIRPTGLI